MKDNKFRGWNELDNEMIDMEDLCFVNVGSYSSFLLDILDGNNNNIKLMQYTGQKDKNKKEIYEGDICIHTDAKCTKVGVVKFMNMINAFRVVFVDGQEYYFISETNEVIGNIYENIELMEK